MYLYVFQVTPPLSILGTLTRPSQGGLVPKNATTLIHLAAMQEKQKMRLHGRILFSLG